MQFCALAQNGSSEVNPDDGEWRSPVAHSVWDRGVASSNLVSPTTKRAVHLGGLLLLLRQYFPNKGYFHKSPYEQYNRHANETVDVEVAVELDKFNHKYENDSLQTVRGE